jgi:hypothetical protein
MIFLRLIWSPNYQYSYDLDKDRRNLLVPAVSRFESDDFLDQYFQLFGHLGYFIRSEHPNSVYTLTKRESTGESVKYPTREIDTDRPQKPVTGSFSGPAWCGEKTDENASRI